MEAHTRNWGIYEETARANGHTPNRKDWRVVGMFHIAETREQVAAAVELAAHVIGPEMRVHAPVGAVPHRHFDFTHYNFKMPDQCFHF